MYIAIAGNIGSGKTTLTEILTRHYNAKAYYEESNNPYIGDFYNDMQRWAFHLQIYFLGSRIQQTLDMLASGDDVIVQDRTIYEDAHIFADNLHQMGLMSTRDLETYMGIFRLGSGFIPRPDLLIYLRASVPTLTAQIRQTRARLRNEYRRGLPLPSECQVRTLGQRHLRRRSAPGRQGYGGFRGESRRVGEDLPADRPAA